MRALSSRGDSPPAGGRAWAWGRPTRGRPPPGAHLKRLGASARARQRPAPLRWAPWGARWYYEGSPRVLLCPQRSLLSSSSSSGQRVRVVVALQRSGGGKESDGPLRQPQPHGLPGIALMAHWSSPMGGLPAPLQQLHVHAPPRSECLAVRGWMPRSPPCAPARASAVVHPRPPSGAASPAASCRRCPGQLRPPSAAPALPSLVGAASHPGREAGAGQEITKVEDPQTDASCPEKKAPPR